MKSEKDPISPRGPQKRSQRSRQLVLEAALRLIARRGLGAVRFRAVADAAGVSLGVVTYHFPTRRDLLSAAFALHLEETDAQGGEFSEDHGAAWQAGTISLDEATDAVIELLGSFVHEDRDSFIASHELALEVTRDPLLQRDVQDAISAHHKFTAAMVAKLGSSEPELDSEIIASTLQGLALKWLARPDDPEFEVHLRKVVRRLMQRVLLPQFASDPPVD